MAKAVRISGNSHPEIIGSIIWLNLIGIAFFVYTIAYTILGDTRGGTISAVLTTMLWYLAYYTTKRSFIAGNKKYNYLKSSARRLRIIAATSIFFAIFIFAYTHTNIYFIGAVVAGFMSAYGSVLYYGWPQDEQTESLPVGISQHKLVQLSEKADALISALKREVYEVQNVKNKEILRVVINKIDTLIDTLEKDPKSLYSSRKLINIYLEQSVDITKKLNDAEKGKYSESNNSKYQKTMLEFIEVIDDHHHAVQAADADSLDTQIEVLKQRLKGEGL